MIPLVPEMVGGKSQTIVNTAVGRTRTPAEPVRIGVVGCGHFGSKRIEACATLPDHITIVGAVETNAAQAKHIQELYTVPVYPSLERLLSSGTVEAVIISVPNAFHADLTTQALSAGCHVLCEKPLAISHKAASCIVAASKRTGKLVKTGSNHRFFPAVKKAQQLLGENRIGKLLRFTGSIGTDGQRTAGGWFWNRSVSGGGTFIDNGCHLLDIARMFMGDFTDCVGFTANTYWKQAPVEDHGVGVFINRAGQHATITASWAQWSGYLYFELWGDNGYIIVDNRAEDLLTLGEKGGKTIQTYDFSRLPKNSYREELLYFTDCIRTNTQPLPSAADGAAVIRMIEGVYTSAATQQWVKLTTKKH